MITASKRLKPASSLARRPRAVSNLQCDRRGVAALEFALIAPALILMLTGLWAVSQVVRAKMLLTSTASSMATMVAAQTGVTGGSAGTLRDLCNGAQLIMQPYAASKLSMSIISYTKQSSSSVQKDWEYNSACQLSASSISATGVSLATPLLIDVGDSIIIVQANYSYASPSTSSYTPILPASMTLSQIAYARPRYNSKVTCAGCS